MLLELVSVCAVIFNAYFAYRYFREKKILYNKINKTMEEVSKMLQIPEGENLSPQRDNRLYGVAASGRAKHYLGKQYDVDELKGLGEKERANLYKLYEAKLSREMIDSMGSSLINLYTRVLGGTLKTIDLMGYRFRIDSEDKLAHDLERDPTVTMALGEALCETYYKFGSSLGPIMMSIITMKHVRFDHDEKYYQDDLINGAEPRTIDDSSRTSDSPHSSKEREEPK